MQPSKEIQEFLEEKERAYRELHPLTSDERSQEILEASSSITLDDYNPNARWTFTDGESPFEWYDAQVRAINHFGHIFCINPFYSNMKESFYGWEFESTEEMLARLTGSWKHYSDMSVKTIKYLKAQCGIEFPNSWGDQFIKAV